MEVLFVYGTLKESKVQKEIMGRAVRGTPDTLEGYSKSQITIEGESFPIAVKNPKGNIEGLVLELAGEELKKIDEWETAAYTRTKAVLKSGKHAWFYQKA